MFVIIYYFHCFCLPAPQSRLKLVYMPNWECSRVKCSMKFGLEKTTVPALPDGANRISFDSTPVCVRRTDGQTDRPTRRP